MNNLIPRTLRCRVNGITIEVCHGKIPDVFRQLRFDPVTEFELPDNKMSDKKFQDWLREYRYATYCYKYHLLKEAQCN